MTPRTQPRWIAFSERVYRVLLHLYPADYRQEYGGLMTQLFRDVCHERLRRQGWAGVALWWCRTCFDLGLTVIEQRRKVRLMISRATFVHFAGLLLILGGALNVLAAFSQFQPDDHTTYDGLYALALLAWAPGQLFVGLGCVGLVLREGQPTGARRALQLTALGALVMASGMIASLFRNDLWTLWFAGAVAHLAGLLAVGILHARRALLPCFRWLPLQMALGWVIVGSGILRFDSITANNLLGFLMFAGMGLAWLAIGQALQRGRQAAQPAAA